MKEENKKLFEDMEKVPQEEVNKKTTVSSGLEHVGMSKTDSDFFPRIPTKQTLLTEDIEAVEEIDAEEEESNTVFAEIKPIIRSKSDEEIEKEYGVKKEADGKVLTISSVEIMPYKSARVGEDGTLEQIQPSKTLASGAQFYSSKMKIKYVEDNIVEYYPSIRYWVNNNVVSNVASLNRDGSTKVSQILRLAMQKMSNGAFELEQTTVNERTVYTVTEKTKKQYLEFSKRTSDKAIIDWMVGKKVKIKTSKGTHNGRDWFRNDIIAFV